MAPLDVLLTQVPYVNRPRVKTDIDTLLKSTSKCSLLPKIGLYVHVNGTESRVVILGGTIPIYFGGAQYNIPVDIYVPERYPNESPIMYVRPTANMIVKHNHKHVDMNGLVYLPYLHDWNTNSNLLQMVEVASSIFSGEPPLFSTASASVSSGSSSSSSTAAAAGAARPSVTVTASVVSPAAANTNNPQGATYSATGYSAAPYPAAAYPTTTTGYSAAAYPAAAGSSYASYPAVSAVSAVSAAGYGSAVVSAVPAPNTKTNNNSTYGQTSTFSTYNNNNNNNNNNNAGKSNYGVTNSYGAGSGYAALPTPSLPASVVQPQSYTNTNTTNASNQSATVSRFQQQEAEQKSRLLAVEKHSLNVQQVNQKLRSSMQQKHEFLRDEIVKEMENERYLLSTNHEEKKKEMEALIEQLQRAVLETEQKTELLKEFQTQVSSPQNAEGENKAAEKVEDDESWIESYDPLSMQIMTAQAELLAIQDAFFILENALRTANNKTVDIKCFTKQCRELARRQFMAKMLCKKIAATCRQAEATAASAMASELPHVPQHQVNPSLMSYEQQQRHSQQQGTPIATAVQPQQYGGASYR